MIRMAVVMILMVILLLAGLGVANCGDDGGGCPGKVCTDCSASGDCDVSCTGNDEEYCGAFGYFDDPSMRCAFCAPPGFQP